MPQVYEAGAIFLARVVLDGATSDLESLRTADLLRPDQVARMRRSMQGAHKLRRIPAGDANYLERARENGCAMQRAIVINDDKLTYIWNRFRGYAFALAQALSRQAEGRALARRLVEGFRTPQCRLLLRDFRAQYDRRNPNGSDGQAYKLRLIIMGHVETYAREGRSEPAGFLKSYLGDP